MLEFFVLLITVPYVLSLGAYPGILADKVNKKRIAYAVFIGLLAAYFPELRNELEEALRTIPPEYVNEVDDFF